MAHVIVAINPGKRVLLKDSVLPDTCCANRPRRRESPEAGP
jgi:hypothetical protein